MTEKRKYGCYLSPPIIDNNSTYVLGKDELMNLTKVAKAWNFTCSFCYKSFPSAQAMGGHQNAHRGERLEEKRLFVKDPIRYRKRAYLRAMQTMEDEYSEARGGDSPAASEMVTHEIASINSPPNNNFVELIAAAAHGNNNVCQSSNDINSPGFDINGKNLKNFFPVKELSLAENVGVHAEGAKGKAITGFDFGCYGASSEDLDLTLRL